MTYPSIYFANIFLYWVPNFIITTWGLVYLYIFLISLPIFIQIFLTLFISIIRAQLRIDIRPILDLLLLPGSILRLSVVWLTLRTFGFSYRLSFSLPDAGESASSVNRQYRGLSTVALQSNKSREEVSPIRIAFWVSLASYSVIPFVILLLWMAPVITYGMTFFIASDFASSFYIAFILIIGFGGLPVPEETFTIVYVIIYEYPQIFIALILNLVAMAIYAPFIGAFLSLLLFMIQMIFILLVSQKRKPIDRDFLTERIMQEIKAVSVS